MKTTTAEKAAVPPPAPIDRVLAPFREFAEIEASGGIVLMVSALVALIWANSPWSGSYFDLWDTTVTVGAGGYELSKALHLWVNDGLMAVFFFVVGLEIKRELLVGELSSPRKAALPIAAALGGAMVPAAIFLAFNAGTENVDGWGIPMATDIAFSLGVLALLGSRVPLALKVFLTAFAIIDDLIAVLVIALFYTSDLKFNYLAAAAGVFVLFIIANRARIHSPIPYGLLGVVLWCALLQSGIHATIAGVLGAMAIPSQTRIDVGRFVEVAQFQLDRFRRAGNGEPGVTVLTSPEHQAALHRLTQALEQAESPMARLEHGLHPWVAFGIVPIFALANAGVDLGTDLGAALTSSLTLGITIGLIAGKPIGIVGASYLAVRLGLTELPGGAQWRHILGISLLGGIGFTMSLFIAGLAFDDPALLDRSKIGILLASAVAGTAGFALLRAISTPDAADPPAGSGDDNR